MSNGHQYNTIIDHYNDWNFKKVANLHVFLWLITSILTFLLYSVTALYTKLTEVKNLFLVKENVFQELTKNFMSHIEEWNESDWLACVITPTKQVICVYYYHQAKDKSLIY